MVYDIERIGKIVSDIEKYFNDLKELDIKTLDDLDNKRNFYSASMVLFSIINRAIDLGDEIVIGAKMGIPGTYKEIFRLLSKNKIIDKNLEKKLSNLVFYRNLLSHEYYDLTEKDVYDVLKRIDVINQFVERCKLLVREKAGDRYGKK